MAFTISKSEISSFVGDVLPIYLKGESEFVRDDIHWTSDSDAVSLHSFAGEGDENFSNGVLIILKEAGNATVTAECEGEKYSCRVEVHERMTVTDEDELLYFIGDFHDHTSMIHKHDLFRDREEGFPEDYIKALKEKNDLDFSVVSDHASTTNNFDFFRGFKAIEDLSPEAVVFPGSEGEITAQELDRFGINRRVSGEIVTMGAASFKCTREYGEYYKVLTETPEPIAIFAHPQVLGFSTKGIWNFKFEDRAVPEMLHAIRGIEVGPGNLSGENLLHELVYSSALDAGFRVSTTCTSDCHGPDWGYNAEGWEGKTVIMAPEKSREAFHDALRNNRFYATESANIKLRYFVNGKRAPADLPLCDKYSFHVEITQFKEDEKSKPVVCRVISDKGLVVKTLTDVDFTSFDFEVESDSARYFYLRITDSEGKRTHSFPVWTSREFDKKNDAPLIPLDMTGASAVELECGKDASTLIDQNPENPWNSETKGHATVMIDLKEEREFSAVGLYPVIILRKVDPPEEYRKTPYHEYARMTFAYRVSVSLDGERFEEVVRANLRAMGDESVTRFEKKKARFIKLEILSNVGDYSEQKEFLGKDCTLANFSLFE